jgi:hypothetical protein
MHQLLHVLQRHATSALRCCHQHEQPADLGCLWAQERDSLHQGAGAAAAASRRQPGRQLRAVEAQHDGPPAVAYQARQRCQEAAVDIEQRVSFVKQHERHPRLLLGCCICCW